MQYFGITIYADLGTIYVTVKRKDGKDKEKDDSDSGDSSDTDYYGGDDGENWQNISSLLSGFGYGIYDLLGGTAYDNAIFSWNNKDYFNATIWAINGISQECLTLLTFGEWGAATKAGTIGSKAIGSSVKAGTKAVSNGLSRSMKPNLQFFQKMY
jgi:hypothetical protein